MWGSRLKKMFSEWGQRRNEEGGSGRWPWIMLRNQASTGLQRAGIEVELSEYQRLSGGDENLSPRNLLQGESTNSEVISDLDAFFERLYKYYCGKGLWCIATQWVVELLSLGFTICFSGFFLLIVDWQVLHTCGVNAVEPCDLVREAVKEHPLNPFTFLKGIVVTYLTLFSLYWVFCFLRFFTQLREILEVRHFYCHRLCVSDRELQTSSWPALLDKIVKFQQHQRLCVVRELSAHDVVMRVMRRENYLIGMLNKGVLAVPLPAWVPGSGPVACHDRDGTERRLLLTKTLEWSLNWCILQHMFDRSFLVRKDFINNPTGLRRRLMGVGFTMLLLSPFLIIFMFVYFFLRHAEEFYHHPSTATSRRWSNLAKWIFREFNEMDHMFNQRLNCCYKHAVEYMKQFPSMILSMLAKFISFVAGGFAAILLIIAFLDESLLEAHLFGRNLIWFAAVFGTITAISRSAIIEEFQVFEPEKSLRLVACFTHYMPKHWRGAENKDSVRAEFESLFQYTGMTLLEELISIFVTPYTLFFLLPKYVEDVLQFIRDFTVRIDGVGDVCSLSVFDFEHHGNQNYGSPFHTNKAKRSCQGKMEKSFLSFQSSYPHWEPDVSGKRVLSILADFQIQSTESQLIDASLSLQLVRPRAPQLDNSMFSLLMQPGYGFKWPLSCSSSVQQQVQPGQFREDLLFWGNNLAPDQLYWLVDRFYASHSCQIGFGKATDLEASSRDKEGHPPYCVDSAHPTAMRRRMHREENTIERVNFHVGASDRAAYEQHLDTDRSVAGQAASIASMSRRMHREENTIEKVNFHVGASDRAAYEQHWDTDRSVAGQAASIASMSSMHQEENLMDKVEVCLGASDHAVYEHLNTQKNVVLGQASVFPKPDEINQWWLQHEQPSTMTHGSFLEPPMYGAGHFAGSNYESSLDSEEDQERAWDLMHSRRAYTSSILEERVSDFDLPFGDVYDVPQGVNGGNVNNHLHSSQS